MRMTKEKEIVSEWADECEPQLALIFYSSGL